MSAIHVSCLTTSDSRVSWRKAAQLEAKVLRETLARIPTNSDSFDFGLCQRSLWVVKSWILCFLPNKTWPGQFAHISAWVLWPCSTNVWLVHTFHINLNRLVSSWFQAKTARSLEQAQSDAVQAIPVDFEIWLWCHARNMAVETVPLKTNQLPSRLLQSW